MCAPALTERMAGGIDGYPGPITVYSRLFPYMPNELRRGKHIICSYHRIDRLGQAFSWASHLATNVDS